MRGELTVSGEFAIVLFVDSPAVADPFKALVAMPRSHRGADFAGTSAPENTSRTTVFLAMADFSPDAVCGAVDVVF